MARTSQRQQWCRLSFGLFLLSMAINAILIVDRIDFGSAGPRERAANFEPLARVIWDEFSCHLPAGYVLVRSTAGVVFIFRMMVDIVPGNILRVCERKAVVYGMRVPVPDGRQEGDELWFALDTKTGDVWTELQKVEWEELLTERFGIQEPESDLLMPHDFYLQRQDTSSESTLDSAHAE